MPQEQKDAKTEQDSSTAQDANRENSSGSENGANSSMSDILQNRMKELNAQVADEHVEEKEESSDTISENDNAEDKDEKDEKADEEAGDKSDEEKSEEESEDDKEDKSEEEDGKQEDNAKTKKDKELEARLDKHPRFQELNQKVKQLEPDANLGRAVRSFIATNKIPQQTYNEGLEVMKLMAKGDVQSLTKVREALTPIMANIDRVLGNVLDDDLKAAVEAGEMTEARAKQLQRLQNERNIGQRSSEQDRIAQAQQAYVTAMDGWVADKMRTDPSYKPAQQGAEPGLYETVEAFFSRACAATPPKNPQEAVGLAEQSYKQAKQMFSKRLTPALTKKKVLRSETRGGGSKSVKEPGSLSEVLEQRYAELRK